jgi:polyhydroxybutyrate depolymerase
MEHSWYGYRESVSYLQKKGSISGYPDGLFHPKETVNRAEFLKLVFRSRGNPEPVSGECFSDVPEDAWFAPFVCAAKRRGIIQGYAVGSRILFKPEQPIVFAEAVKMAVLAYGSDIAEGSGEYWYKPYIADLDRQNILSSSSYIPWAPISRERASDLIARFVRHTEDRIIANHSPGCGKTERNAATTLTVGDLERSYLLTKPGRYESTKPAPLIIAFHGRTNSNEQVRKYFGLDRSADGYFIAYPAAIANAAGTSFSWSDPRDIDFFDSIVEELAESYCIDMDRIFVAGHSLGAWFSNTVACVRGGVVRASATVGGSTTQKNCAGPSAAMILNNPKDTLSSHTTAATMRDIRGKTNACGGASTPVDPAEFSCVQYSDCPENPVVWCPHTIDTERDGTYYPHVWPKGTAEAMVEFFEGL